MRGDRPPDWGGSGIRALATPHARGSTLIGPQVLERLGGYPACAGIDHRPGAMRHGPEGYPACRIDPHGPGLADVGRLPACGEITFCATVDTLSLRGYPQRGVDPCVAVPI